MLYLVINIFFFLETIKPVDVQFVHIINVIKSKIIIHYNFGQSLLTRIPNTACPRALGLTSVNGLVYKHVMILNGVW
jgi:hypothetical protein